MDRETTKRNVGAGLMAGAFVVIVFSLSFVAAALYIAQ